MPALPEAAAGTAPRTLVDYVVTEHGIASLRGQSIRERIGELIAVAHPDFRSDLKAEAQRLHNLAVQFMSKIRPNLEADPQGYQAAERRIVPPFNLFRSEPQIRPALHNGIDGNLPFHSGQGGAQTKVGAEPERQVAVVFSVQPVRV